MSQDRHPSLPLFGSDADLPRPGLEGKGMFDLQHADAVPLVRKRSLTLVQLDVEVADEEGVSDGEDAAGEEATEEIE